MKKQPMHTSICLILTLTLFCSCQQSSTRLEHALQLSGENRNELEKVLDHYSKDSLKLKATLFLIENMPGHYALDGPFLRNFKHILDTTMNHYLLKKVVLMQPARFQQFYPLLKGKPDLECIKGDYLIHNIDLAFRQWETLPWLEGLSFDDFCEYLLPYRIDTETLDYWKDSTDAIQTEHIREAIQYFDNQKYSAYNIGQQIFGNPFRVNVNDNTIAGVSYTTRECVFSSRSQLIALRAAGIPSVIDYVPCWADMNGFHQWAVIIDPKNNDITSEQLETKNAPKVFRRTYSQNEIPVPGEDEYIPPFFTDPFNRDVTGKYQQTTDIEVKLKASSREKIHHAYLSIFNQKILHEVSWSKVQNHTARFCNMGRNIVYFPVYFDEEESKNFAYPLILGANGKTRSLEPDKTHPVTIKLTRKYPLHSNKAYYGRILSGARFTCSDNISFQPATTVHVVKRNPNMFPVTVKVDTTIACQYWQFDHEYMAELAEWVFKDDQGKNVRGKIINPTQKGTDLEKIFDGNALSYGKINCRLIVDFGKPVRISEMTYLPRNDANGIYPGDEYELFYYDLDGWHSMGCKIATDYYLEFDSVPANAVYWLRNHTVGEEERVFTWQNGQQRFW